MAGLDRADERRAPQKDARNSALARRAGEPLTVDLSRSEAKTGAIAGAVVAWSSWGVTEKIWKSELAAAVSSGVVLLVWLAVLCKRGFWVRRALAGKDGVVVRGPGYERFVPYAAVERADYGNRGVMLRLHGGGEVPLSTFSLVFPTQEERARRDVLLGRIRRDLFSWRAGADLPADAALLERGGRSAGAWRTACLGAIAEASAGYRRRALAREQAVEMVENPAAPVELRVGAALALSSSAAEEGAVGERIRVAIDTCVNPEARAALRSAVAGELDEDALSEALSVETSWRQKARAS